MVRASNKSLIPLAGTIGRNDDRYNYSGLSEPNLPRLLEVHPDFSIPSNFYPASLAAFEDPLTPSQSLFASAAAQQLPYTEGSSSAPSTNGSSWGDRRDRLESLDQDLQVSL